MILLTPTDSGHYKKQVRFDTANLRAELYHHRANNVATELYLVLFPLQVMASNCSRWPNCTAGTLHNHNHILLAWMTGGGYQAPEYSPKHNPAFCEIQVFLHLYLDPCLMHLYYFLPSAHFHQSLLYDLPRLITFGAWFAPNQLLAQLLSWTRKSAQC